MRPYLNGSKFSWSMDTAFDQVMEQCKTKKRAGQNGTWIFRELQAVFSELHAQGYAHSVEVWSEEGELVGGLYGLALGKIFFGESMFAKVSNASKYGFIQLVGYLKERDFTMIDCQQQTQHLTSLGAEMMSKELFFESLKKNIFEPTNPHKWTRDK